MGGKPFHLNPWHAACYGLGGFTCKHHLNVMYVKAAFRKKEIIKKKYAQHKTINPPVHRPHRLLQFTGNNFSILNMIYPKAD